jgi:uncharacterized membrane protein
MIKRKWIWVFATSLGLNLFFAGFLTARCAREERVERLAPPMMFGVREALGDAVPPPVQALMKEHAKAVRIERKRLRTAHHRAREAMAAEPFDPTALDAALEDLRSSTLAVQTSLHHGLVQIAQGVDAEQRQKLAASLGRRGQKH